MNGITIYAEPLPDACPDCKATYRNIGHPLRPGVIMQRACDCEYITVSDGAGTVTVRATPEAAALWRKSQVTLNMSMGVVSMGTQVPHEVCPDCPPEGCLHVKASQP